MLFVNLIPLEKADRFVTRWWKPVLGALAFAVSLFLWIPNHPSSLRPLEIEEQQAVLLTLSHLKGKIPELREWVEQTEEIFSKETLPAWVESTKEGSSLVRLEEESLIFTPGFFDADSAVQERALGEIVFHLNQTGRRRGAPEIAVIGD